MIVSLRRAGGRYSAQPSPVHLPACSLCEHKRRAGAPGCGPRCRAKTRSGPPTRRSVRSGPDRGRYSAGRHMPAGGRSAQIYCARALARGGKQTLRFRPTATRYCRVFASRRTAYRFDRRFGPGKSLPWTPGRRPPSLPAR